MLRAANSEPCVYPFKDGYKVQKEVYRKPSVKCHSGPTHVSLLIENVTKALIEKVATNNGRPLNAIEEVALRKTGSISRNYRIKVVTKRALVWLGIRRLLPKRVVTRIVSKYLGDV